MQFAHYQSNKSALLLAAALMALVAALALSSVAHAAGSLSFGDAPTGWSITPGEADGNIGKVKATGVKKNRIRYAISGASGFSIKAKSGVVSYDGSAASGSEALLLVTARDRKGKVENATVTVTVSVAGATEPVVEVKRHVTQQTTDGAADAHNHADELKIVSRSSWWTDNHRRRDHVVVQPATTRPLNPSAVFISQRLTRGRAWAAEIGAWLFWNRTKVRSNGQSTMPPWDMDSNSDAWTAAATQAYPSPLGQWNRKRPPSATLAADRVKSE